MNDKAILIVCRLSNHVKEFLFIKPHNELFLELPSIKLGHRDNHKKAVVKLLKSSLRIEYENLRWIGFTSGQPYGWYVHMRVYAADLVSMPNDNPSYDDMSWFNQANAMANFSRFSEATQAFIFPYFDKQNIW
jgi:hypothetical protein